MELVKALQAFREKAEGAADDDLAGLLFLQFTRGFQHTFTGGDHIVDDDDGLAVQRGTQVLVRHDRVLAVDDAGVIASLIEHTHVNAQVVGKIHGAGHGSLIRADDDQMILVDCQVTIPVENRLDKLIGRGIVVEPVQRDGILNARIMRVKGDDVRHAQIHQLLQGHGAVKRLAARALMLTAFIQKRHDNVDAVRVCDRHADQSLQILEMIVRRHVIFEPVHLVSEAVVGDIGDDKQVRSSNGFIDNAFGLSGAKARATGTDQISVTIIPVKFKADFLPLDQLLRIIAAELNDVLIDFLADLLTTVHCQDLKWRDRQCIFKGKGIARLSVVHGMPPSKLYAPFIPCLSLGCNTILQAGR